MLHRLGQIRRNLDSLAARSLAQQLKEPETVFTFMQRIWSYEAELSRQTWGLVRLQLAFVHATPLVQFQGMQGPRGVEIGDLLIVFRRRILGSHAAVFQAKMPNGRPTADQQTLYENWPTFRFVVKLISGREWTLFPAKPSERKKVGLLMNLLPGLNVISVASFPDSNGGTSEELSFGEWFVKSLFLKKGASLTGEWHDCVHTMKRYLQPKYFRSKVGSGPRAMGFHDESEENPDMIDASNAKLFEEIKNEIHEENRGFWILTVETLF